MLLNPRHVALAKHFLILEKLGGWPSCRAIKQLLHTVDVIENHSIMSDTVMLKLNNK